MSRPPHCLAWRHVAARDGFEVAFVRIEERAVSVRGHTAAVECGKAWTIHYDIELDDRWRTRSAYVTSESANGLESAAVVADGDGRWIVNGRHVPGLDGTLDLDLESSALTNAFPVRRLALDVGERAEAPAAYVRAGDLRVERLEQSYLCARRDGACSHYAYAAPAFDVRTELTYDEGSFVLDYPGLAVRML